MSLSLMIYMFILIRTGRDRKKRDRIRFFVLIVNSTQGGITEKNGSIILSHFPFFPLTYNKNNILISNDRYIYQFLLSVHLPVLNSKTHLVLVYELSFSLDISIVFNMVQNTPCSKSQSWSWYQICDTSFFYILIYIYIYVKLL